MLTSAEIHLLLNRLADKTVVEPTKEFPYRVSVATTGYSEDLTIAKLQAKLSILLEVATNREIEQGRSG